MDVELLIVTTFLLLFVLIIGGTILLFPLSRKLGHLIEARIAEKSAVGSPSKDELRQLAARLSGIESQLESLAERQEFLDKLVAERRTPAGLPHGGERTD
jgi:hypothetical protein